MIYKSRKEYDQALKNLDKALHDGAAKAARESGTPGAGNGQPRRIKPADSE